MRHAFECPDSDAIASVWYDDEVEELHVVMRKGQRLVFGPVPMSAYKAFEQAPSKGTYFNKNLRWGEKYPFLGEV